MRVAEVTVFDKGNEEMAMTWQQSKSTFSSSGCFRTQKSIALGNQLY